MELIIGIAIGAAFAPFWMKAWEFIKDMFDRYFGKKEQE